MHPRQPSRTAFAAATHRAAHQVLEGGNLFRDPLALTLLGVDEETVRAEARAHPERGPMRFFIAARTVFAESAVAEAVAERGATQLVVLGAGLDTFAYRSPFGERLRVFEVDHPATQAWKRQRLAEAGIAVPPWLTFAPVDFEDGDLMAGLAAAGFDPGRRSVFTWLGVVPYLSEGAIFATLGAIAGLEGGAEVVFDYSDPPSRYPPEYQAAVQARAAAVAAWGEPFLSHFDPEPLHVRLRALGLTEIEDLGPRGMMARYAPEAKSLASEVGGHVVRAGRP